MKLLITGFDPFGGENINPATEAVKALPDTINGAEIIKLEIPTVYRKSLKAIEEAVKQYDPDVILSVGQAGGRFDITVERIAMNLDDYRIKDNEGNQPIDEKIYEDGENAYFSSLPIKAMVKAMNDCGVPASVSNSAGSFVCNHVMYGVLYMINKEGGRRRGGFIHIPFLPEQAVGKWNVPSMSKAEVVKGLTAAIGAIVDNMNDIKVTGGTDV
jgi:pyroglutamyl-peptidase